MPIQYNPHQGTYEVHLPGYPKVSFWTENDAIDYMNMHTKQSYPSRSTANLDQFLNDFDWDSYMNNETIVIPLTNISRCIYGQPDFCSYFITYNGPIGGISDEKRVVKETIMKLTDMYLTDLLYGELSFVGEVELVSEYALYMYPKMDNNTNSIVCSHNYIPFHFNLSGKQMGIYVKDGVIYLCRIIEGLTRVRPVRTILYTPDMCMDNLVSIILEEIE